MMADNESESLDSNAESRRLAFEEWYDNPISRVELIYQLWWHWADFQLYISSPYIPLATPPKLLLPEALPNGDEVEFVYPILDSGSSLATSKGKEIYQAGMSMCKLFFTIEKMVYILIERLKNEGIDAKTEVQVAFGGHQLAQRKAFESIINLKYNVVVTNFDPGVWGSNFLENSKLLFEKGYGYPSEAPRDTFRHDYANTTKKTSR